MKKLLVIICLIISGCAIPVEIAYKKEPVATRISKRHNRIKGSKEVFIIAISIETGLTNSAAMFLWENYKSSNIKGFYKYLVAANPFQKTNRVYRQLAGQIKARTKILKKGRIVNGQKLGF